jgi:hypothetical protein
MLTGSVFTLLATRFLHFSWISPTEGSAQFNNINYRLTFQRRFSYLVSGTAWTARLYLLTPRILYSEAYRQARAYTRAFFSTSRHRWPVFADPDPDPDPSDPHVFGPPGSGSGSISQRYGSGSGSFYHQVKIVRKTLFPTALWLLFDFLSLKMM